MKLPCARCVAVYLLGLPPLAAVVMYRQLRKNEGFKQALESVASMLKPIADLEKLQDENRAKGGK